MAIDTTNEKLGLMEWCSVWEPGLPISPGTIDQADQQQFLWGYPGILWAALAADAAGTRRMRQMRSLMKAKRRKFGRRC